jgi:hypothetical protein
MPDFKQGKIYCLRSHQTDDIYIGSTTQTLSRRKAEHRRMYKRWQNGELNYITSFELTKHDDCYIELLEEYPCDNRNQLERREGQLIRETDCVNKCIAGRTIKEWVEENKEKVGDYQKKYREENKEKIKKYVEARKNDFKCEVCNYSGCKGDYNKHLKTKKHIKNSS